MENPFLHFLIVFEVNAGSALSFVPPCSTDLRGFDSPAPKVEPEGSLTSSLFRRTMEQSHCCWKSQTVKLGIIINGEHEDEGGIR